MNRTFIALGSNMGEPLENIKLALKEIEDNNSCDVLRISSIYETKPFGFTSQDNFLNAAAEVNTTFALIDFFRFVKAIEYQMGRMETVRWGPRIIDIDILFFNDLIYSDNDITIPHKRITERDFVVVPLSEIAPDFIHPVLNKKISDICIDEDKKTIIGTFLTKDDL